MPKGKEQNDPTSPIEPVDPHLVDEPHDSLTWSTPQPTIDDGWTISATIAATERGAVIESLRIKPSNTVIDPESGELRDRDQYETPSGGITWKVLNLIKLDDIRGRQANVLERHLDQITTDIDRMGPKTPRGVRLSRIKKKWEEQLSARRPARKGGRPPVDDSERADQAEQYLEAVRLGPAYRERLARQWEVSVHTVDTRRQYLHRYNWIWGRGRSTQPGQRLKEWRRNQNIEQPHGEGSE